MKLGAHGKWETKMRRDEGKEGAELYKEEMESQGVGDGGKERVKGAKSGS